VGLATVAVVGGLDSLADVFAQPIRAALVLPLVVFVPGYALVAALFPAERDLESSGPSVELVGLERFVLSFVVSLGLVPLVAFGVNYTLGLTLLPILLSVATVSLVLLVAAYGRRVATPVDARWGLAPLLWTRRVARYFAVDSSRFGRAGAFVPTNGTQRLFNVVLVFALLTFFAGVAFAVVVPPASDKQFTGLSALGETDQGNLSTRAVPDTYTQGESTPLWIGIGNHEEERTSYTTVITVGGEEVDRFSTTVEDGETKRVERAITPTQGGDQTLRVLLYKGDPGGNPNPEDAYRTLRIDVTVQ
jgi:uncharacterized membrane protein